MSNNSPLSTCFGSVRTRCIHRSCISALIQGPSNQNFFCINEPTSNVPQSPPSQHQYQCLCCPRRNTSTGRYTRPPATATSRPIMSCRSSRQLLGTSAHWLLSASVVQTPCLRRFCQTHRRQVSAPDRICCITIIGVAIAATLLDRVIDSSSVVHECFMNPMNASYFSSVL